MFSAQNVHLLIYSVLYFFVYDFIAFFVSQNGETNASRFKVHLLWDVIMENIIARSRIIRTITETLQM